MMLLACYDMWQFKLKMAGVMPRINIGKTDKIHCYRAQVSTGMRKTTGFKKERRDFLNFIITMKLANVKVKDKSMP